MIKYADVIGPIGIKGILKEKIPGKRTDIPGPIEKAYKNIISPLYKSVVEGLGYSYAGPLISKQMPRYSALNVYSDIMKQIQDAFKAGKLTKQDISAINKWIKTKNLNELLQTNPQQAMGLLGILRRNIQAKLQPKVKPVQKVVQQKTTTKPSLLTFSSIMQSQTGAPSQQQIEQQLEQKLSEGLGIRGGKTQVAKTETKPKETPKPTPKPKPEPRQASFLGTLSKYGMPILLLIGLMLLLSKLWKK